MSEAITPAGCLILLMAYLVLALNISFLCYIRFAGDAALFDDDRAKEFYEMMVAGFILWPLYLAAMIKDSHDDHSH